MNIKQKIKQIVVGAFLVIGLAATTVTGTALAAECGADTQCCGNVATSILSCDQAGGENASIENTGVWGLLLIAINILTGLVALAAVVGVVYGSVLYTSAGGNQEQVKKAMGIITNVVIGVIAYALMYSLSNFLIPGGIFA